MKLLVKDSIECILNRIFVCNQKQKQQKRWNLKCIVHQKTHSFWNWIYTTSIEGFKCYITRVSSQESAIFYEEDHNLKLHSICNFIFFPSFFIDMKRCIKYIKNFLRLLKKIWEEDFASWFVVTFQISKSKNLVHEIGLLHFFMHCIADVD